MSNPIKIDSLVGGSNKFYIGPYLVLSELKLIFLNDIIADEDDNYYTIMVGYGDADIVLLDIKNNIIFKEKDGVLDFTSLLLAFLVENPNPYVSFAEGFINFSILKTGLPTGLEGSYFIINQWEKAELAGE